jgi:uncharacterized HhH-GPD family protein
MQKDYIHSTIQFLERDLMPSISFEERGYASLKEANDLIFSDPLAFVLGLIFDQSIKSSMAWEGPFLLKKRLGHLDAHRIATMDYEELKGIIATKKALHRYPGSIAKHIISTCETLTENFSGEAVNLWKEQHHFKDVKKNFLSLKGIGEKKANLAILMLARDFDIQFDDIEDLPLAIDVHLKRVLDRSGFLETETPEGLKELHRKFKEQYHFPALIGTAIWSIGRHYCHETSPLCDTCPITQHCIKRIHHE